MTTTLGCQSNPQVGEYFNRPLIEECITLEQPGYMACNGQVYEIPARRTILRHIVEEDSLRDYYSDKEFRLYICLNYPKRCK